MSSIIGMNGPNNPPQGNPININLQEHPNVKCEICSGVIFETKIVIKRINKLITGSPQDQLAPIQIIRCSDCGEVLPESLPDPNLLNDE